MAMLDLIVEAMDIPQRDELVKRIRQFTGQTDPNEEPDNPEAQAKAQAAAEQQAIQKQGVMAQLRKSMADASLSEAKAKEANARVSQVNMTTQRQALDAAGMVSTIPSVADIADHMLHEAGYISRSDQEQTQMADAQAAGAAQQQQQQQQEAATPQMPGNPPSSPLAQAGNGIAPVGLG
jgi:hypothetical protein